MNDPDVIVQRPDMPNQLLLLFHGVGSSASDIAGLGQALAPHLPRAFIVSVQAPAPSGRGWQWFSVQGVTEDNRPARVAAALPGFVKAVEHWQTASGLGAKATTLIGFSQGAIMALESTQLDRAPATRVLALSGRFAQAPRIAHDGLRTHAIHGDADPVMPVQWAIDALARLQALGAHATLDRIPGLAHGIDARVVEAILARLQATFRLDIGPEQLVVQRAVGDDGMAEQSAPLGAALVARRFFRHDPPTATEIEQAIDYVEDEIMQLDRRQAAGAGLWTSSAALRPWAAVSGPTISIETVEHWFDRLALAAQGRRTALDGLPQGTEAAATLLVLREFMHHRGHPTITVVAAAASPSTRME